MITKSKLKSESPPSSWGLFFTPEPQSPINPGVDLKINRSLQITFTLVFHPPSPSLPSFPCCIEIGFFVALPPRVLFLFLPIAGTGFLSSMLHGRPRQDPFHAYRYVSHKFLPAAKPAGQWIIFGLPEQLAQRSIRGPDKH